jgi:transcriptional regulator with XRE-family HTH domain
MHPDERRENFIRLGRMLALLRESKGLDLVDVASRAGVGYSHVYRLERGYFQTSPAFDNLVKVGAVLGLSPNDLARELGIWKGEDAHPIGDSFFASLADYVNSSPRREELMNFLSTWLKIEREKDKELVGS